MAVITSIEQQVKDKNRCNIYIDGRFFCGIMLEVVVKYHLKAGVEIDEKQLVDIQLEEERAQALDKALTHISATMKTKKQVVDFLAKKGYTSAVIDYVIEKMVGYNYIDDYAYCKAYIAGASGKGKKKIEVDLMKRGAERSAIEAALDEVEEDEDEVLTILTKYMRGKEFNQDNLYKGFKYLMSKGFDYDIAKSAIEKYGNLIVEDDSDDQGD